MSITGVVEIVQGLKKAQSRITQSTGDFAKYSIGIPGEPMKKFAPKTAPLNPQEVEATVLGWTEHCIRGAERIHKMVCIEFWCIPTDDHDTRVAELECVFESGAEALFKITAPLLDAMIDGVTDALPSWGNEDQVRAFELTRVTGNLEGMRKQRVRG